MDITRGDIPIIIGIVAAVMILVGFLWLGDDDEDEPSAPPRRGVDERRTTPMSEKQKNPNQAQGRQNAPGQNKTRVFINDTTGETVEGTMNDFHDRLKGEGYRPLDQKPGEDQTEEAPPTPTQLPS